MTKSLKNWLRMQCAAERHKYTKTWSKVPRKNNKTLNKILQGYDDEEDMIT